MMMMMMIFKVLSQYLDGTFWSVSRV